ncbi:gamma-aminobutyraldehyde dehydrogenase [Propionibacterium freudenreichii]|uniref:gamma-aminobutyraldehyde dehydrogenase n=1 Tax=Propionibacterium freudenreichii TaxID=1744 RepID=UPI0021A37CC9|nr:gamma-aminobutyraldehyde dehydrogenase [Propionibacterium freudenreichii]MCT2979059.1 gamma-aminobutyraldehyde dehydrogenase [Propionibacterium freudenreichii]MCT2985030.1 gamma-aminobutyraldehyde dehydrogenase [Propionibacterium freudenreichii]MCT2986551.1 gamma-aminobutyraldehyde dehydrogenase [Propionibacterium freudenreichii]
MALLQNFINNRFVASTSTESFNLVDPATAEVTGQSPASNQADVDAAYAAAKDATRTWGKMIPGERQRAMLKLADAIEAHSDELVAAQSRNTGQPKHLIASEEVTVGADQIRFFAGAARIMEGLASGEYMENMNSVIRREPIGVVGQVTPWNYPLMMAIWKIGPALAAGNTIVLKPSDTTPESTQLLAQLAAEFLPEGTFNVVLGRAATGAMVVGSKVPGLVSITGSVRAGIEVAKAAAENLTRCHLELGGKAPCIVFDDADVDAAAEALTTAGFFNAGQDCTSSTRLLVQAGVHDEFVAALAKYARSTRFGSPDDADALYGPLNNANQLARVQQAVDSLPAHAEVVTGGKQADRPGFYFEPTVLDGLNQDDALVQNEIFGPVLTVQTFDTEDQAVAMGNGVPYGLASSVWTRDHARALRMSAALDFGCVWINCHIPLVAEMPHGGFKSSGYGKDLSKYSVEEYTRVKHVMSSME